MSSTRIETLVDEVQAAFDYRPEDIEDGLETNGADVLQLRKSCRLLAGAETLLERGFYTLVIEASFVAIERVAEFKLLEGGVEPRDLPGTHPGVYTEAARRGILSGHVADSLQDLWRNHRSKTYYQDGLAARERRMAANEMDVQPVEGMAIIYAVRPVLEAGRERDPYFGQLLSADPDELEFDGE